MGWFSWAALTGVFGIVFLAMSFYLKRTRGTDSFLYNMSRELGIAALVATAGVSIVDANTAARHEHDVERIKQLFLSQRLPDMLEGAVGRPTSSAIQTQILEQKFVYRTYEVSLDLEEKRDSLGEYLSGKATSVLRVFNRSQDLAVFTVQQQMTDVLPTRPATFDKATVRRCDGNGNATGPAVLNLDATELAAIAKDLGATGRMFSKSVSFEPNTEYTITYENSVNLDITDEYVLRTRFPCEHMSIRIVMPEEFTIDETPNHPGGGDPAVFTHSRASRLYTAELRQTCLPYQGIRISWTRGRGRG